MVVEMLARHVGSRRAGVMHTAMARSWRPRNLVTGRQSLLRKTSSPSINISRHFTTSPALADYPENKKNVFKKMLAQGKIQPERMRTNGKLFRLAEAKRELYAKKDTWWHNLVGSEVGRIDMLSLDVDASQTPVETADAQFVCSYNWATERIPTIYAPGAAAMWTPPDWLPKPIPLPAEYSQRFIDQNGARVPRSPFEPLFRAIEAQPSRTLSSFDDIDVVCNRNSLIKLFKMASLSPGNSDGWVMRAYLVGSKTLVVERHERAAIMGIPDGDEGPMMENVCTTWPEDVEESSGHYQVLRYSLGDLDCVVRFEVDAAVEEQGRKLGLSGGKGVDTDEEWEEEEWGGMEEGEEGGEEEGTDEANWQAINTPPKPKKTQRRRKALHVNRPNVKENSPVTAIKAGTGTPPEHRAELKARQLGNPVRLWRRLPQLWFGRTRNLLLANHHGGVLKSIEHLDVSAHLDIWPHSDRNQNALRRVVGFLRLLRELLADAELRPKHDPFVEKRGFVVVHNASLNRLEDEGKKMIRVYHANNPKGSVPLEVVNRFWSAPS